MEQPNASGQNLAQLLSELTTENQRRRQTPDASQRKLTGSRKHKSKVNVQSVYEGGARGLFGAFLLEKCKVKEIPGR